MTTFKNIKLVLISPKELALPEYLVKEAESAGMEITVNDSLEDEIGNLDILYMTRVQGERFADKEQYERLKDSYV